MIQLGQTIENGTVRIHRYTEHLKITDITNAGKRGKTVNTISACSMEAMDIIKLSTAVQDCRTFEDAKSIVNATGITVYENSYKGIHVKPAGFKSIIIENENVKICASYDTFSVSDLKDINLERVIPSHYNNKSMVKKFYKWASNKTLNGQKFDEIIRELNDADIDYHRYCAMD